MPLLVTALAPEASLIIIVPVTSLLFLALLGALAAGAGGAQCDGGRNTRHVLGRTCHGNDRRRWGHVRNRSIKWDQRGRRNRAIGRWSARPF